MSSTSRNTSTLLLRDTMGGAAAIWSCCVNEGAYTVSFYQPKFILPGIDMALPKLKPPCSGIGSDAGKVDAKTHRGKERGAHLSYFLPPMTAEARNGIVHFTPPPPPPPPMISDRLAEKQMDESFRGHHSPLCLGPLPFPVLADFFRRLFFAA